MNKRRRHIKIVRNALPVFRVKQQPESQHTKENETGQNSLSPKTRSKLLFIQDNLIRAPMQQQKPKQQ